MDLSVNLLGYKFDNPLMPASGPLVEGLDNLRYFNEHKVGAIVTKTISVEGAKVKKPCIVANNHMVHNTELWSELDHEIWVKSILPTVRKEAKKPVIVSVGYTSDDMSILVPKLEPFADFFEVSTHYNREELKTLVTSICSHTTKSVFVKLSPHIVDYLGFVEDVMACGASGIVAVNSLGPGLVVDLKRRGVKIGAEGGKSWVSGPAIKPIALYRVMHIRQAFPRVPIIACGGVETAEDILEFMLAGADLVQMLSSALIEGRDLYDRLLDELPSVLGSYGFSSIEDLRRETLNLKPQGIAALPKINASKCTKCGRCIKSCPTMAMSLETIVEVSHERCVRCGLCESRCPVAAISGVL